MSGEVTDAALPGCVLLSQGVALAAACWLFEYYPLVEAVTLVWAVGFSHYLLGLAYSWRATRSVLMLRHGAIALALLAALGTGLYVADFSLALYFGLHHALNEAYISGRFKKKAISSLSSVQLNSFLLHLLGFFLITHDGRLQNEPMWHIGLLLVLVVLFVRFSVEMLRNQRGLMGSELVIVLLIPLDLWTYDIHLYHIVLYHFLFWIVFPLMRMRRAGGAKIITYGALTIGSIVVFVALIPQGVRSVYGGVGPGAAFYEAFVFLSFIHITLSFATSRANPAWINRIFAN